MSIPIKCKPDRKYSSLEYVLEIPEIISSTDIDRLKLYAADIDSSGLHRRGSKDSGTKASFYTCLVFNTDDPIYQIIEPAWQKYIENVESNISFIEPYEIKQYLKGDSFGSHVDTYINLQEKVVRKLNLIIQLSNPSDYVGGNLMIGDYICSREQGTGIFFPANATHKVTEITEGSRFSLIGHAWGPYQP